MITKKLFNKALGIVCTAVGKECVAENLKFNSKNSSNVL